MKDPRWSVIRCLGPESELMWSVVHRRKPMFIAVVSDRSLDQLEEIPPGAIHWAKRAAAPSDRSLLRQALETIRSSRYAEHQEGEERPPPQPSGRRRPTLSTRGRLAERGGDGTNE